MTNKENILEVENLRVHFGHGDALRDALLLRLNGWEMWMRAFCIFYYPVFGIEN